MMPWRLVGGTVTIPVAFYFPNRVNGWWIVPMAIREIGITILRLILMARGVVIAAEKAGKLKVVAQLVSLFLCYLWLMGREHLWRPPAVLLDAKPLLVYGSYASILVATAFTLYSGYTFLASNKRHFVS